MCNTGSESFRSKMHQHFVQHFDVIGNPQITATSILDVILFEDKENDGCKGTADPMKSAPVWLPRQLSKGRYEWVDLRFKNKCQAQASLVGRVQASRTMAMVYEHHQTMGQFCTGQKK